MNKYSSLPTPARYLSVDSALEGIDSRPFTVLNSFKDSREAIDEIWKSVTLEGSQLTTTAEVTNSHSSQQASVSSSLAVNASDADDVSVM